MWDIHAHVIPAEVIDAAHRGLYRLTIEENKLKVDGDGVLFDTLVDIEQLIAYATTLDLKLLLSVPPALIRNQKSDESEWFTFVNDALLRVCEELPFQAEALGVLPMAAPQLALKEWERIQDRMLGLTMASDIQGELLSAVRFDSFWCDFAASGGGLAFIHGGRGYDPRLKAYYLDNLVGYPAEDTLAVASLVFSSLPLLHPEIQWCISHGGGSAAFLLGRWQRGYETKRPGIDWHLPSPQEVFQALWLDSAVHDGRALNFILDAAPHRVVLGTDYPFPMGTQYQIQEATMPAEVLKQLSANTEDLISRVTKGRTIL